MPNDVILWTQRDLQAIAKTAALEAIQSQGGLALPCQVIALNPNNPATGAPLGYSFVQVQFEVNVPYTKLDGTTGTYQLPPLILPKAEGQWVRSPTQVGDMGVTQSLDTAHGGISGMSAGVANTGVAYGNLSTLVFVPIGNANFGAAPDPNKVWVNGPAGAVTSDTAQTATSVIAENTITHTAGVGGANQVYTLYDGVGRAISHVGPTGLGALYSSLGAARAVPAQADLQTAVNNVVNQSMVKLMAAIGGAMLGSSSTWATAQGQLNTIFAAAGFVPGISGILPSIPSCSSITRVAP